MDVANTARVDYRILGPIEVAVGGDRVDVRGRSRAVLAALLLRPNEVVSLDRLIDRVWGDDAPPTARKALQVYVSQLRAALGERRGTLRTLPDGYVLDVAEDQIDAARFEKLVRDAVELPLPDQAALVASRLHAAVALWRGRALEGMDASFFFRDEATRLEELRLDALERLAEAELALGRHATSIERLSGLVLAHPLRERFWALLMMAQSRCGRQADALDTYRRCRDLLVEELALEPGPELRQVHQSILAGEIAPDVVPPRPSRSRNNLPIYEDSFIGREFAVAEVGRLLSDCRFLTILGPGGVGKTRLAVEVAHRSLAGFPDGTWLVDLAPLDDPTMVADLVAETVGAPRQSGHRAEDVRVFFRDRVSLLILDNCEHLTGACRELIRHLLGEARPNVLCTSREPLGIEDGTVWRLDPLLAPRSDERSSLERLCEFPSVRLLLDRARAAGFGDPTGSDAPALERISSTLDGIPLAIELAAARAGVDPLETIADGLEQGLELVRGGVDDRRHGTLGATVRWSLRLLDEDARTLIGRMSIFRGSMTIEAIDSVCARGLGRIDGLVATLQEKSLLSFERTRWGARYRLLETVKAVVREEARDRGEMVDLARRHAMYFHARAVDAGRRLQAEDQAEWLARVAYEVPDLRAAFDTLLAEGSDATAVELFEALWWAWYHRPAEGSWWLERVGGRALREDAAAAVESVASVVSFITGDYDAALASGLSVMRTVAEGQSEVRLRALMTIASVFFAQGDPEQAEACLQRIIDEAAERELPWWEARALATLAHVVRSRGEFDLAEDLVRRARAVFEALGDRVSEVDSLAALGAVLRERGDLLAAQSTLEEAYRIGRSVPYVTGCVFDLALVLVERGEYDRAVAIAQSGLEAVWEHGHLEVIPTGIEILGAAFEGMERSHAAAVAFGAAARMRQETGAPRLSYAERFCSEHLASIRRRLGDGFTAAWEEGRQMGDDSGWRRLLTPMSAV